MMMMEEEEEENQQPKENEEGGEGKVWMDQNSAWFPGHIIKDSVHLMVTGKPDEKKEKGGDKTDDKVRKKVDKT